MLNKKSLLNRVFVGIGIFVVMIGMILIDVLLPNYEGASLQVVGGRAINSIIISALIALSVIEMRRAIGKEKIPDCFSWLLWIYAVGVGIAYSLFGFLGITFLTLLVFVCATVTAFTQNKADSLIYIAFMLVYPGLFMSALLYINRCASTFHISENNALYNYLEYDIWQYFNGMRGDGSQLLPYNAIGLAFVFAVSTFTDTFAYFAGGLFGKHKLCEHISPNKTVEGAIGGLFGGLVGSFVVFVLFDWTKIFGEQFGLTFSGLGMSVAGVAAVYIVIGLFGSVMTQIGDLLASLIKRHCNVKDYSRILGEHGGIMDRFDGIMLNSVFVAMVFMFII